MDLFEYQGKQFFAGYGMPISPGEVAFTVDEAVAAAERLGTPVMVKAQVHTGGRGKAGGVKFAATLDDVREHAGNILGLDISGHVVGRVWIEQASDIAEEYYASFDADLVEINPLILTDDGRVHVLDAKVTLDANSVFRHESYAEFDGTQTRDERETAAHAKGLQYVGLDGSVGVIANGAGLAMSTVDVVNQVGGSPANFLDIGGGANADVMAGALEVINNDPAVRSIFINIFGGITRGDEVANGIVEAIGRVDMRSPIVIRLDGTNADEGRAILEPHLSESMHMAPTMLDAARQAVALAGTSRGVVL